MTEKKFLDLSWGSIFKIGFLFFLFLLIYQVRGILVLTLFSIIFSILFEPAISFLKTKRISRVLAVLLIYFSFLFVFGLLVFLISAPILSEIQKFSKLIPEYFGKISPYLQKLGIEVLEDFETFTKSFQEWLAKAALTIFSAISILFGGIFSTLTIFSLSIFLSLEENGLEKIIAIFSPPEKKGKLLEIFKKCQEKISKWFGIKILGCFFVGILSFVTLKIFKVDYAFSLSLLAGFLNLIPILGPVFTAVLITLFIIINSFPKAIFFLLAFILIQQIEGNVLIPILTKKVIELSPFLVLFSLLVGGKLFGFWGALLGIPLAAIIFEFLKEFFSQQS